ncbi:uncharacterized protein LOC110933669 [Helianthus annuus]|uniref:uncharacterized protein LOC110933669 n=1 Tax=Helianthus annuus TaxID=4232 RepID=UPI000B905DE5|nr:uncharacterized protein LOC110933669 [Helianthus annuus]
MGDNEVPARRVVADYARPNAANGRSSITRPAIGVNRWQIPPQVITMVTNTIQFHGLPSEDPNVHISRFSTICDTFQEQGITEDAYKLHLFPFSLADRAHAWLESLPAGSITTWAGMKDKFLGKYFPPSKTARLRSMIQEFRQKEGESFYETWEHFKELLLKCPHHGFEDWALVEKFYHGVTPATRNMHNTTAGGNLMTAKTPEECTEIFEDRAMSSYEFPDSKDSSTTQRGVHKVDDTTRMQAQIDALMKKMNDMESKKEQNNFGDRYNLDWKNHPNFSWKNNNPPGFQVRQNLFQDTGAGASSGDTFEVHGARDLHEESEHCTALQNLERTVGSLADQLNQRPQVGLPSSTVRNPNATTKAVTTRSGRGAVEVESIVDEEPVLEEIEMETPAGKVHERLHPASTAQSSGSSGEKNEEKKEPMRVYKLTPPYPGRLIKGKDAEQYGKFLEMLKKLHVNIPFVEALSKMLKYVKFLKDLLTNKKKLEDLSTVTLSEECSAVLQNKLLKKVSDPGRPFHATERALIDVHDGKFTLRVDEDEVTFDIQRSMRHTQQHDDTLYFIDTLMSHVGSLLSEICGKDASDTQVASVDD